MSVSADKDVVTHAKDAEVKEKSSLAVPEITVNFEKS